jgi:hypothetical protein
MPVNLRLLDLAPDKYPLWAAALPDTGPLGLHGSRLYRDPVVRAAIEAQLHGLAALDAPERVVHTVTALTDAALGFSVAKQVDGAHAGSLPCQDRGGDWR